MIKLKSKTNNVELLAPAGNINSFKAACTSGADAIYMGVNLFNARVMAENFTIEEYIKCIKFAHLRGIKVYLTLNTLIKDDKIKEALEIVIKLYSNGLDAVILQDIGLASLIHEIMPKLHMHASTQMSIYSLDQVKLLEKIGFKRVVLARELTINEIEYICKNTNLEIEVFVHGALCVSMSGQCLLSSLIGGRSANNGNCAQPCRMMYSLYDKNNNLIESNKYLLSKKDIYGLENLNELKQAGVYSFKIEGRNKNAEYVYATTKIYRKYLYQNNDEVYINKEKLEKDKDKYVLKQVFNRDGLDEGYFKGIRYKDTITLNSPKNMGIFVGKVLDVYNNYVKVKIENTTLALHDGIEIYSANSTVSTIITCIKDENGNITNKEAKIDEYIWIGDIKKRVKKGDKIYKTSSNSLNTYLKTKYLENSRRKEVIVNIKIKKDEKINVSIPKYNINFTYDYIAKAAINKPITIEDIINAYNKTLDSAFIFKLDNIKLDNNLFIPTSILNDLRRMTILKLENLFNIELDEKVYFNNMDKVLKNKNSEIKVKCAIVNDTSNSSKLNSLFIYTYNNNTKYINEYFKRYNKKVDIIYFNIKDFIKYKEDIISKYLDKVRVYLYIPNYVGNNLNKYIKENIEELLKRGVSGVLIGSLEHLDMLLKLKNKYSFELGVDYSLNITNIYSALIFKNLGIDVITPSVELGDTELLELNKYFNIEVVKDMITVMTSRYCILGSFVANRKDKDSKCSMPCLKNNYYITDTHNAKYKIVCDNIDCIMRLVRQRREENLSIPYDIKRIRKCIL